MIAIKTQQNLTLKFLIFIEYLRQAGGYVPAPGYEELESGVAPRPDYLSTAPSNSHAGNYGKHIHDIKCCSSAPLVCEVTLSSKFLLQ